MTTSLSLIAKRCFMCRHLFIRPSVMQWRSSQYAYRGEYLEPTLDREELLHPLPEDDPRKYTKIKAAGSDSAQMFYNKEFDVQKFINMMMLEGKKALSRKILMDAFEEIKRIQLKKWQNASELEKDKIELNPLTIFKQALANCKPSLMLTGIFRGGITYQVPGPIREKEAEFRAKKWMIHLCREHYRTDKMYRALAREMIDAYKGEGKTIKKKQELHKQCEANRAFAHYRWS